MASFAVGPSESWGLLIAVFLGVLLIAASVIVLGVRSLQGGDVERSDRVAQVYGYALCLIGLLWSLTSAVSVVDNALSLSAPELRNTEFPGMEPSVSSFEAYRATSGRSRGMVMSEVRGAQSDTLSDAELRRRFEALLADRTRVGTVQAHRAILLHLVSFLIGGGLFLFHWRWLKKREVIARAV